MEAVAVVAGCGSGTSGGASTGGRSAIAVQRLHQSMAELRELSGITSKAMTIVDTITIVTATSVGITTATATTGIS